MSLTSKGHFSFRNNKLNKRENGKNTVKYGLLSGKTIEEKLNSQRFAVIIMENNSVCQSYENQEQQKNHCLKCRSFSNMETFHRYFQMMSTIKTFLILLVLVLSLVDQAFAQQSSTVGKSFYFIILMLLIVTWYSL